MQFNADHGIEPQTIIKSIRDINDRLRAVAENTVMYSSERRDRDLAAADTAEVERLVAKMEAEMKSAAKQLEFERAAALRDEIQQIRLRVLEQDASVIVARAAERAARDAALPAKERAAAHRPGGPGFGADAPAFEVTEVRVLQSGEEPGADDSTGHRRGAVPRDPRRARGRRRRLAGALARPPDLGPHRHPEHPPPDRPASVAARPRVLNGPTARSGATSPAPSGSGVRAEVDAVAPLEPGEHVLVESRIMRGGEWLPHAGFLRVTDRRVMILVGRWLGRDDVIEVARPLVRVRPALGLDPVIRLEVDAPVDDDLLAFRAWDWFPPGGRAERRARIRQDSIRTTQLREQLEPVLGLADDVGRAPVDSSAWMPGRRTSPPRSRRSRCGWSPGTPTDGSGRGCATSPGCSPRRPPTNAR